MDGCPRDGFDAAETFTLLSPVGADPAVFHWSSMVRSVKDNKRTYKHDPCQIIDTIRLVCEEVPELKQSIKPILLDNCELMSFSSIQNLCELYNKSLSAILAVRPDSERPPLCRPSTELLRHVLDMCYDHAVLDPDKLNQYSPFSPEVYGETSFELVDQMIRNINFTAEDRFLDLGSGVGQVVLHIAAATSCSFATGVEKAHWPAFYAKQMEAEFIKWMEFYGKTYGKFSLERGNFLLDNYLDIINSATIIFVNNFAFGPDVDHQLKLRFSNLKEGARIISSKAFCPMNFHITNRNLGDIGAIMTVKKLSPMRGRVSWTDKPVSYYIHTIDRTMLENFFATTRRSTPKSTGSHKRRERLGPVVNFSLDESLSSESTSTTTSSHSSTPSPRQSKKTKKISMHSRLQRRKLIRKLNALTCASDGAKADDVAENDDTLEAVKTTVDTQPSSEVMSPEPCPTQPSGDKDKDDSDAFSFDRKAVIVAPLRLRIRTRPHRFRTPHPVVTAKETSDKTSNIQRRDQRTKLSTVTANLLEFFHKQVLHTTLGDGYYSNEQFNHKRMYYEADTLGRRVEKLPLSSFTHNRDSSLTSLPSMQQSSTPGHPTIPFSSSFPLLAGVSPSLDLKVGVSLPLSWACETPKTTQMDQPVCSSRGFGSWSKSTLDSTMSTTTPVSNLTVFPNGSTSSSPISVTVALPILQTSLLPSSSSCITATSSAAVSSFTESSGGATATHSSTFSSVSHGRAVATPYSSISESQMDGLERLLESFRAQYMTMLAVMQTDQYREKLTGDVQQQKAHGVRLRGRVAELEREIASLLRTGVNSLQCRLTEMGMSGWNAEPFLAEASAEYASSMSRLHECSNALLSDHRITEAVSGLSTPSGLSSSLAAHHTSIPVQQLTPGLHPADASVFSSPKSLDCAVIASDISVDLTPRVYADDDDDDDDRVLTSSLSSQFSTPLSVGLSSHHRRHRSKKKSRKRNSVERSVCQPCEQVNVGDTQTDGCSLMEVDLEMPVLSAEPIHCSAVKETPAASWSRNDHCKSGSYSSAEDFRVSNNRTVINRNNVPAEEPSATNINMLNEIPIDLTSPLGRNRRLNNESSIASVLQLDQHSRPLSASEVPSGPVYSPISSLSGGNRSPDNIADYGRDNSSRVSITTSFLDQFRGSVPPDGSLNLTDAASFWTKSFVDGLTKAHGQAVPKNQCFPHVALPVTVSSQSNVEDTQLLRTMDFAEYQNYVKKLTENAVTPVAMEQHTHRQQPSFLNPALTSPDYYSFANSHRSAIGGQCLGDEAIVAEWTSVGGEIRQPDIDQLIEGTEISDAARASLNASCCYMPNGNAFVVVANNSAERTTENDHKISPDSIRWQQQINSSFEALINGACSGIAFETPKVDGGEGLAPVLGVVNVNGGMENSWHVQTPALSVQNDSAASSMRHFERRTDSRDSGLGNEVERRPDRRASPAVYTMSRFNSLSDCTSSPGYQDGPPKLLASSSVDKVSVEGDGFERDSDEDQLYDVLFKKKFRARQLMKKYEQTTNRVPVADDNARGVDRNDAAVIVASQKASCLGGVSNGGGASCRTKSQPASGTFGLLPPVKESPVPLLRHAAVEETVFRHKCQSSESTGLAHQADRVERHAVAFSHSSSYQRGNSPESRNGFADSHSLPKHNVDYIALLNNYRYCQSPRSLAAGLCSRPTDNECNNTNGQMPR